MIPVGTEALPLFWEPVARRSDPDTSHLSAALKAPRADKDRAVVLNAFLTYGKGSDFDCERWTGIAQTSGGVRRGELVKAGLMRFAGTYGKSPRGAVCREWEVVP